MKENGEWKEGVTVSRQRMREIAGRPRYGRVIEADFELNYVKIDLEDGHTWEGTSQEFEIGWEPAP